MKAAEVDDILDEMNKKYQDEQTSASVDESSYFPQGESFDSVEELRERIQEEKLEQNSFHEGRPKRVYLKAEFILEESEVLETLKLAGIYKTQGNKAILYTIIMAVAAVGFFLSCFYGNNFNWLFFGVLCLIVIGAIWIVPTLHLKKLARENTTGDKVRLEITNEDIIQRVGDKEWIIPLDKTGTLQDGDEVIIVRTYHGQVFTIPKRSIEKEIYKKILQIIKNGTEPYEG